MAQLLDDNIVRFLIAHSFECHKSTVKAGGCVMYEYFIRHGIMKRDPQQIRNNLKEAADALGIYASELGIINYAKALCVDALFLDLKLSNRHIRELTPGPTLEMNK